MAGLGLHQAQPVPGPSKAASSGRLTSTPRSPSLVTCIRGGLSRLDRGARRARRHAALIRIVGALCAAIQPQLAPHQARQPDAAHNPALFIRLSAISPLLANIFLHYAFDAWMTREHPGVLFERYSDDVIVHCRTGRQAQHVRDAIAARLADVGLELNEPFPCAQQTGGDAV